MSGKNGYAAGKTGGKACGVKGCVTAGRTAGQKAAGSAGSGAGLTAERSAGLGAEAMVGLGAGLTAARIYSYLDGDMSSAERQTFEEHLAVCPACSAAVAARRRIVEAAESLPPFAVPDGFAAAVMARVVASGIAPGEAAGVSPSFAPDVAAGLAPDMAPARAGTEPGAAAHIPLVARVKRPRRQARARRARRTSWAWAATTAAGLALTAGAAWVLISGRSLSDVAFEASRFLWGNIRGLATLAAKSWSYGTLAVKVLGKLAEQVLGGFKVLSSFIGPEVQIACLGAALVLAAGGFALWRRKFGVEKNHDES